MFAGFHDLTEAMEECAAIQSSIISITSTEENEFLIRLAGNLTSIVSLFLSFTFSCFHIAKIALYKRNLYNFLFTCRNPVQCFSPRCQLQAANHSGILGRSWLDLRQRKSTGLHKLGHRPAKESWLKTKHKIGEWEMANFSWFKNSTYFLQLYIVINFRFCIMRIEYLMYHLENR